ncbi:MULTISPECIES: M14 family metallopeptidase [Croceitalea]|uniref:M14 family metallopeptidase n=1 Tax=Croceitalea vernalis TaxID=3075599 RepID=A0ABU3BH49_9FLAO|nr:MULTISPECIES: M14 family metallopeptidase [unclassified Croceitalea]MDT0539689.1 M14 family metallopeptidase [Croceitalea sp. P059]MDT0621503.1 M14 family metallopeptidase [Croceitalea sp. P007]
MKSRFLVLIAFLLVFQFGVSQEITEKLYETYGKYKEITLDKRRIKHIQIEPLIEELEANPLFEVNKVGKSIEGRDLNLISVGTGRVDVFLWSQMHGNEPTATQAIFDIVNFLDSKDFKKEKALILSKLKLHFLPMLNPDGAERFQRRNLLGIDINRDALRLQSPEGRTLKRVRDSLDADFGFNLHDQSTYYNAERTPKPATISYLAPAYNYEKDVNEKRGDAMKVIVFMNDIIQRYAPGQVGRYNDDFEPRAFGDNIQKWGTSTILIESGGYKDDAEKQEIRKLNYVSILSAIYTIANESYKKIGIDKYEEIPKNDRKLFDLKIENVSYNLLGDVYILDLGIHRNEVDNKRHIKFHYSSVIADQGDLSTYYGYETFDATGYEVVPPRMVAKTVPSSGNEEGFYVLNSESLLKFGQAYIRMASIPKELKYSNSPIHVVPTNFKLKEFRLEPGVNPTFFLKKDGEITHAVINGFLIDVRKPLDGQGFSNALIYR